MDPVVTSSLIKAGGSLLGGFLGRSGGSSKRWAAHWDRINQERLKDQRAREDTAIRRAVHDAKAAGLHPLFALGAGGVSGGNTPVDMSVPSIYEPSSSGSTVGDVFDALGEGFLRKAEKREQTERQGKADSRDERLVDAQVRSYEARAKADEARAMLAVSEAKRAQQAANYSGRMADITQYPKGTPLSMRNVENLNVESHPTRAYGMGPQGPDFIPYMPPSLGGDEINQVIWPLNRALEAIADWRQRLEKNLGTYSGRGITERRIDR